MYRKCIMACIFFAADVIVCLYSTHISITYVVYIHMLVSFLCPHLPLFEGFFFMFVFATCDGWACDFYPPNILVSTQTKCNVLRGASGQGNQSGRKQRRDQLFLLHKTSFSTTAGCRNNTLSLSLSVLFHLLSITLSSTATNPVVRAVHSICYPVSSLRDNLPSGLVELSWRKTVVHDGNESLTSPKRNLKPNPV